MVRNSHQRNHLYRVLTCLSVLLGSILTFCTFLAAQTAPSTYSAYTGTDTKVIPPAPALGAANSIFNDVTFGSRLLRVTDANTNGGESFVSIDSGFIGPGTQIRRPLS